jgi:hypothetical protein
LKASGGKPPEAFFMPTQRRQPATQGVLYHSPVSRDHGDQILPLSAMLDRYPDLYRRHHAKYVGRESVLNQPVPPLNCTWADVVFFSPVDSTAIFDALRQSGRDVGKINFCTLDARLLDPDRTCIRLMRKSATAPEAEPADEHDYLPFTTGTLRAVSRVTDAALQRLRTLPLDQPWLPWVDVPHVLHRGEVPIDYLRP